jgi:hypothetical protein
MLHVKAGIIDLNSREIELTCFAKSPLAPLYPPGQRPYGPAAKEG